MTFMSHLHPQFDSVFSMEAVNEPIMNATQTPGLGDCEQTSHDGRLALHSRLELCSSEEFRQDSARGGVAYRDRSTRVSGSRRHAKHKESR